MSFALSNPEKFHQLDDNNPKIILSHTNAVIKKKKLYKNPLIYIYDERESLPQFYSTRSLWF